MSLILMDAAILAHFLFAQRILIWYVTLPTAEILSGKNARAWASMVLYFKN